MLEELCLSPWAGQSLQHGPASPGRIIVKGGPGFAKPSQPAFPFRTELRLQLFAKALREGPAMADG